MNYFKICLVFFVLAHVANAQPYRTTPARIYVTPDGTTRIISPSPNATNPGRYYDPRTGLYYEARSTYTPPPTSSQLHVMNWSALRQAVNNATRELDVDMHQVDNNNTWKRGLQTKAVRELMAHKSDQPPDQFVREQLQSILLFYEATRADRDSGISHLASIRTIQSAISELLSSPLHRHRRQLAVNSRALDQNLAQFGTGAQWRTYLALPDEVTALDQSDDETPEPEITNEIVKQLEKLQSRFEKIQDTPDFYRIANLASFQSTSRDLATYLEMLRSPSGEEAETLTASEELSGAEN